MVLALLDRAMRTIAAILVLSLPLAAQLPTNSMLVLEAWTPFATSIYRTARAGQHCGHRVRRALNLTRGSTLW